MTSFSMASLERDNRPKCPFCGEAIQVNLEAAAQDAHRQAEELDQSVDSLGSIE
jgi:hypothetical protein